MELTLAAAMFAGLISFFSPCCLPVVPAYLGQLGAVSVASISVGGLSGASVVAPPLSRWRVLPHAIAFVAGFAAVFTLLGVTAYAFRPLFDLPLARQVGGIILILLGLNLMGVLRIRLLSRTWRPFTARFGSKPLGGAAARSPLGAFALGSIFAVGWTPCVGPTLGAVLGLSLSAGAVPQVVALLLAYSLGLGIPFVALALAMDGAARFTRPLLRYGRQIEVIGGALVVVIGFAILFDWLGYLAQQFSWLWPNV